MTLPLLFFLLSRKRSENGMDARTHWFSFSPQKSPFVSIRLFSFSLVKIRSPILQRGGICFPLSLSLSLFLSSLAERERARSFLPSRSLERTELAAMPLFRPRQQQQRHADAPPLEQQQQRRISNTCVASLEGLVEASHGNVSLSASGMCRCGLGGEEVHSVQVSEAGERGGE